ncbi:hypothetical protein MNV49_006795 [Pseudohyphozyma bogoriensis]|nr:hypothetical protein MNV49_006795 [Pseudohyphozyma bogoriensis]
MSSCGHSHGTTAAQAKDKGNVAFKAGNLNLALAHYTTAISLDPGEFTYPLNRSLVHLKNKNWKDAEKDASLSLRLQPEGNVKALFRRGLARKGAGKVEPARKDFLDAKATGAGPEVDKELADLPPPSATPDDPLSPPPSSTPAPSAEDAPKPSPTTSRLCAAISPSSSTPSSASSTPPSDDSFMKAVSSRKLETEKEKPSFAAKKTQRESRALNPSTLPQLFQSSLTPDLLSDIVLTLGKPEAGRGSWKVELLKGLKEVRRFDMVVGFLVEEEKSALINIFDDARKELDDLAAVWEIA